MCAAVRLTNLKAIVTLFQFEHLLILLEIVSTRSVDNMIARVQDTCRPCRAGMYRSEDSQGCIHCPDNTYSGPGSGQVSLHLCLGFQLFLVKLAAGEMQ